MTAADVPTKTGSPYPLTAVFAEFYSACEELEDINATDAKLLTNGWARSLPIASSPIGRLVQFQEKQGRKVLQSEGGEPSKPWIYRKSVHGRSLDPMLQSVAMEGGYINGCRLWDFDVAERPTVDALLKLREGEPAISDEESILRVDWPSTEEPGTQGLQIVYLPRGHELSQLVGASGLNFKIAYIGVDQQ